MKIANLCMILDESSNKVLMIDRVKSWKGLAFPGGQIEKGESITASVVREVLEETGLKISEYFEDLYTFKSTDMLDIKFRDDALNLLTILHNSELKFKENFSPLNVFKKLVKTNDKIEDEAKTVGEEIVKELNKIGLDSKPCHQDLYHANFVYFKEKAYLIDWEYSSQGDPFFDYADFIWQNELEDNTEIINDIYSKIGINNDQIKTKMELFQILSMITWGFWAKRKSPKDNRGQEALISALEKYDNNFS